MKWTPLFPFNLAPKITSQRSLNENRDFFNFSKSSSIHSSQACINCQVPMLFLRKDLLTNPNSWPWHHLSNFSNDPANFGISSSVASRAWVARIINNNSVYVYQGFRVLYRTDTHTDSRYIFRKSIGIGDTFSAVYRCRSKWVRLG